MKLRFLLDAHITPRMKGALLRYDRTIEVMRLGDPGMPPLNTLDPEILAFTAQSQQVFVTEDYNTIPPPTQPTILPGVDITPAS